MVHHIDRKLCETYTHANLQISLRTSPKGEIDLGSAAPLFLHFSANEAQVKGISERRRSDLELGDLNNSYL